MRPRRAAQPGRPQAAGSAGPARRGFLIAAGAIALVAASIVPSTASARVVDPESVTESITVPAGQARTLTLTCPRRAIALNAAPTGGLASTSSIPGPDARSWSFRFAAGAAGRTAGATLRCVRLRLPGRVRGVGLAVGTVVEPVFALATGATQEVAIQCPRGQVPSGWGLERGDDANGLAIAIASPTARGWTFTVENAGAAGAAGSLHARCLERKQRASTGQRHAFSTRVASFSDALSGSASMRHGCRSSEYSVATGVSLAVAGDLVLTATGPVGGRDGAWAFAGSAASVQTSLVCLAKTTRFH